MNNEKPLSDLEIIELLKQSSDNLNVVYKKHRDYCLNFMKKISSNTELNQDVFHDSLIVLYEKVNKIDFNGFTCSIQTYLNSICRNQILVRFKKETKQAEYSEEYDNRITDWFEGNFDEKDEKIGAIVKALNNLKDLGGKCYDILKRYFYGNQSMDKISFELGYTNADNVKNQKARCQKKLKEMVYDLLNRNK